MVHTEPLPSLELPHTVYPSKHTAAVPPRLRIHQRKSLWLRLTRLHEFFGLYGTIQGSIPTPQFILGAVLDPWTYLVAL